MVDEKKADPVFLDFEASSLAKHSYPIEVAWVFSSGEEESHLIRPAPSWTDWATDAESIHRISRDRLEMEGAPVEEVGHRMIAVLTGHALYATAPSWDGRWLSRLLREAGLPRHALRLEDADLVHRKAAIEILQAADIAPDRHDQIFQDILAKARRGDDDLGPPTHRALADARREQRLWHEIRRLAEEAAARLSRTAL